MADQERQNTQTEGKSSNPTSQSDKPTSDPGRTPGKAEGDEQTVDESLRQKAGGNK